MQATLTFSLPEEQSEFDAANHGQKFQTILFTLLNQDIRAKLKYEDLPDAEAKAWEEARALIYQRLEDEGLTHDSLM